MPDPTDHGAFYDAAPHHTMLKREADRLAFAATRVRQLAESELHLLELAVNATNDNAARQLELQADTAWRDALALSHEHNPEPPTTPQQDPD